MAVIISPNMSLPIPGVGSESGPDYAADVNSSLTLVDQHDHSPGRGVQITPAGLNINSALSMGGNFLTSIAGLTLSAQASPPAINTVYESGVDLYFVDGNGNNVRITQSGGVAGSPGSIANLASPASASYVSASSTFVWQSGTSVAANMDFGAAIMRNLSPNSTFALTLQPPALTNNYAITLPTLPASQSFMTIDNSGVIGAPTVYPLTSVGIATNAIVTAAIQDQAVTTAKIADSSITAAKLQSNIISNANIVDDTITVAKMINSVRNTSSRSSVYTNTTTSYTQITSVGLTSVNSSRPVYISCFAISGCRITLGYAGTAPQNSLVSFIITKVVNGGGAQTIFETVAGGTLFNNGAADAVTQVVIPASVLSCIDDLPGGSGNTNTITYSLQAAILSGSSLTVTMTPFLGSLQMRAVQT